MTANVVSRARAVAVLLTAVYALAATMHAQNRRPDNTPVDDFAGYPALIEQYRNGQTKQAVEAVSGRTMFRIPDAIDDWLDQTIRERKVDLLRTALLLHTEAIFKDDRGGSLPKTARSFACCSRPWRRTTRSMGSCSGGCFFGSRSIKG